MANAYEIYFAYFSSSEWQQNVFVLKIISLVISALLLFALIILISKIKSNIKKSLETISQSIETPALPKKAMVKKWESVLEKLESDDENTCKLAVIEADKIFDDLLVKIGYQGEDMGDRLKQLTPAQLSNLDQVWQAHKVRNQIVHQPDFRLTRSQAVRAVEIYQRALEDLEAI